MRVLYVSASDGVHDHRMIDAWTQHGVDVSGVVLDDLSSSAALIEDAIARFEPDVVQAGPIPVVADAVARVWTGPLISTSWGFDLLADVEADDDARARAARTLSRSDAVLVDSDAVRARAIELGAESSALVQFPWGIDHELFRSDGENLREQLGIDGTATCVVSVRRHEALYDVSTVVRAFARASTSLPDAMLLVGGAGSQTSRLRSLSAQEGIQDRVVFIGELRGEKLAALYRTADVYVSTSTVDGSSISLLEAMASGAVPVVTDIPGNREWVQPTTGVLFPVGDHERLADSIVALSTDANSRGRMAKAAQHLVQDRADWRAGARRLRASADLAVRRYRERVTG